MADVAGVSLIAGEAVTDAAEETAVTKSTDSQISTAGITIIQGTAKSAVSNIAKRIAEISVGIEEISILTFQAFSVTTRNAIADSTVDIAGAIEHRLIGSALTAAINHEKRELAGASSCIEQCEGRIASGTSVV